MTAQTNSHRNCTFKGLEKARVWKSSFLGKCKLDKYMDSRVLEECFEEIQTEIDGFSHV